MTDPRETAAAGTEAPSVQEEVLLEDEYGLPLPSPALQAAFDKTAELLSGLEGEELRRAAAELYHDADGNPQLRRRLIRAVPDA